MHEGIVADITILDPETGRDNSTCNQGTLQSTGLPYVLVNPTIVIKDSKVLKDVNPGQPIRFDVQEKRKFGALDLDNWINNYLADPYDC